MASDPASRVTVGALRYVLTCPICWILPTCIADLSDASAIFDTTKPRVQEPIVQCVQIKPLPPQPNHPERYRAVFSDISNYVQTMLATRQFPQPQIVVVR